MSVPVPINVHAQDMGRRDMRYGRRALIAIFISSSCSWGYLGNCRSILFTVNMAGLRIGVVSLGVMWAVLAASYSFGGDGFGWTWFVTTTGSMRGGGAMLMPLSSSTRFEPKI
jgi:hypothetical protein